MRRISGWLLPVGLALAGVALIIAGRLDLDAEPSPTLAPIPDPTPTPVARATPTVPASTGPAATPTPTPTPTPIPESVVATQLEVASVGINVAVRQSTSEGNDQYPSTCCAFILRGSSQPGRGTNSYIFAHALNTLFKPLWNVQLGAEVKILLSDGTVLRYRVTEVRPNVACPDPNPPNPELNPDALGVTLPLALQYAGDDCDEGTGWIGPTDHERVTLQTSQGYNRNWGELVVVAEPIVTD
jgi:hypothetical protein